MTRAAGPKLRGYVGVCGLALLAALALGRPELVVLAAPFAGLVAAGLILARRPELRLEAALEHDRALEGSEVAVTVTIEARTALERLEVLLAVPRGVVLAAGGNPVGIRLRAGETRVLRFALRTAHWGAYHVGELALRARDPLGLLVYEGRVREPRALRVYPRPEPLRATILPAETQVFSGNRVSRRTGEGIELAGVRTLVPGDPLQRVNWRASARRGTLHVTERHQERNSDVILLLDTFAEAREGESGTLDQAVRAAATLAGEYLAGQDRVGVVGFGGIVRWLRPGMGLAHGYRIAEALLDAAVVASFAWKDVDAIPRRVLPPKALVIALTPLLDERVARALLDLRARGFDVAVVEVSPLPYLEAPAGEPEDVARRLWRLGRDALRFRYLRLGIAVVQWREGVPLQSAIEEMGAFRRSARRSRA